MGESAMSDNWQPNWIEDDETLNTVFKNRVVNPWVVRVVATKKRPGKWAEIANSKNLPEGIHLPSLASTASNIRTGKLKGIPEGLYEAKAYMEPDTKIQRLFVRYVGENKNTQISTQGETND